MLKQHLSMLNPTTLALAKIFTTETMIWYFYRYKFLPHDKKNRNNISKSGKTNHYKRRLKQRSFYPMGLFFLKTWVLRRKCPIILQKMSLTVKCCTLCKSIDKLKFGWQGIWPKFDHRTMKEHKSVIRNVRDQRPITDPTDDILNIMMYYCINGFCNVNRTIELVLNLK